MVGIRRKSLGQRTRQRGPQESSVPNCGDCHASVAQTPGGPMSERRADCYCPECRLGGIATLRCPACGSEVCARCGEIAESASELGFG